MKISNADNFVIYGTMKDQRWRLIFQPGEQLSHSGHLVGMYLAAT